MKVLNKTILLLALFGLFVAAAPAMAEDYTVIVNSSNTLTSASSDELSKWFLKKSTKWSDGKKVVPVRNGGDVNDLFCEEIHGKSARAIKSFWEKQLFSGKGTPPAEKGSDAEVVAFVKSNPGAVGYVSAGTDVSGVKVLTVQ